MTEIEHYGQRGSMLEPVTDSWVDTMGDVVKLASYICHTEFVPQGLREKLDAPNAGAKAAAAMLTGRELGLPPMTSLASIHVINGKPGISAEVMRGLVAQRGHEIRFGKVSSTEVTVRGRRAEDRDDPDAWTEVTWTMQEAQRAGLVSNGNNYAKYPRQMLTARATTELCRLLFADVIHGLRSIEELEALGTDGEVTVEYREEPAAPARAPRREPKVQPIDAAPADQGAAAGAQLTARTTTATRPSRRSPSLTRRGATNDAAAAEGPGQDAPVGVGEPAAAASPAPEDEAVARDTPAPPAGTGQDSPSASTPASPAGAGEALPTGEGATDRESTAPSPDPAVDEDGAVDVEVIEDEEPAPREPMITDAQTTKLVVSFQSLGVRDRAERQYITSVLAGREVESAKQLTKAEASSVIDSLEQCKTNEDLQAVVNATVEHAGEDA